MRQKDILKKKDEVMRNCMETLAMILFVRDEKIRADLVVIDEGPKDEVEMCSDLKQGRIQHPRTSPAADKLKHVWYIKGHHPQHPENIVELLIGDYKWNDYLTVAHSSNGSWKWVG
jgi:hypothetical protein